MWETYELASDDGQARYEVSISIAREKSAAGRIAAHVADASSSTASVLSANDHVVIGFERSVPHAAALADHVNIDLGKTPPGSYALTLLITDRTTGKKAERTTEFEISRGGR